MRAVGRYLVNRIFEKSTLGVLLSLIIGAFGIGVAPESSDVIVGAVITALSAIGIITPEE